MDYTDCDYLIMFHWSFASGINVLVFGFAGVVLLCDLYVGVTLAF